jgi:hypothetical protein
MTVTVRATVRRKGGGGEKVIEKANTNLVRVRVCACARACVCASTMCVWMRVRVIFGVSRLALSECELSPPFSLHLYLLFLSPGLGFRI